MKANTSKKPDPIYTDDYYRIEKLIKDPKFKARLKKLLTAYKDMGCPLPAEGFKTHDLYMKWLNKFFAKHEKMMRAGIEDELLPPVPGDWRDETLAAFGFDPKDDKYTRFLDSYIYFGKKDLSEFLFEARMVLNEKTDTKELYVQIYPHTRRDHILKHWNQIESMQKYLDGYTPRNKKWLTFNRDQEIFKLYTKLESNRLGKRVEKGVKGLDVLVSLQLEKKYPHIQPADVRNAVYRMRKWHEKYWLSYE